MEEKMQLRIATLSWWISSGSGFWMTVSAYLFDDSLFMTGVPLERHQGSLWVYD